ncbi:hypothetical protein EYB53_016755 [Candidatus Chloroploca sp. M-50]|uniref:LysM domain-containing protein n=1 Tax=Candidatus Chloroploca mongolica TaxID=2528176 RepID=A0ABS4DD40_9CHLR|nr:hypothetical protein [Candidatus Chloroploca mongolica]MBP1467365.1 hypothetical protein [Candidatus Chloroploca mongolica]
METATRTKTATKTHASDSTNAPPATGGTSAGMPLFLSPAPQQLVQREPVATTQPDTAAQALAQRPQGPPVIFGLDNESRQIYASVTAPGARLEEIATFIYGTPDQALRLGEENGIFSSEVLQPGRTLRLVEGRITTATQQAISKGLESGAIMRTNGIPTEVEDDGLVYQFPIEGRTVAVTAGQFNAMLSGLRRVTSREADRIASMLQIYLETRNDHVNNTNSVVRGISDWMGDVDVPSQMRFILPKARAEAAKQVLDEIEFTGDPLANARQLHQLQQQIVELGRELGEAEAAWHHYLNGTIGGAEVTVRRLEVVRNVSFGMVAGMAGALAAPAAFAALGAAGITGTGATLLSLGAATGTGAVVRGGLEVALPGAQADRSVGDRFASGAYAGSIQGLTGGIGAFAAPAVSAGVTGQLATRIGPGFVQTTGGRLASQAITGGIIGAPSGAGGAALENLPAYMRGDITGDQYSSSISSGFAWGGALGAGFSVVPINGLYRSGGQPVTPSWMLAGPYSPIAPVRGAGSGFHNLPREQLPAFAEDPGVAGYAWTRLRSGGTDQWVPVRTYGPQQQFELAWYGQQTNANSNANFNFLYGPEGAAPGALRLVGSRSTQQSSTTGYAGMAANDPFPGAPRSTRRDFPMSTDDFAVTMPDGSNRRMIRGHQVDHRDTTRRTIDIGDSNLDPRNFTPEPPQWGTLSGRMRLTQRMLSENPGGGTQYRQVNVYRDQPPVTADGTPVPEYIYFIETNTNGTPVRAWEVPFNDPNAFAGTNMHQANAIDASFGIPLNQIPQPRQIPIEAIPPGVLGAITSTQTEQ